MGEKASNDHRRKTKDAIEVFLDNQIRSYLEMIENAKIKMNGVDKEDISESAKKLKKNRYSDDIKDIEQKIYEIKIGGVEIVEYFKNLEDVQRDQIIKDTEDTIIELKKDMEELEAKKKEDSHAYVWKAGMRNNYDYQHKLLMAIKEGKI
jgi:hypothetical protein